MNYNSAEDRRLKRKPLAGSYGFAAMERRLKKRMPPVGASEDNNSDNDLGTFSRSYTPGVSSYYRAKR